MKNEFQGKVFSNLYLMDCIEGMKMYPDNIRH